MGSTPRALALVALACLAGCSGETFGGEPAPAATPLPAAVPAPAPKPVAKPVAKPAAKPRAATQTLIITVPPARVAEGDRLLASHADWVRRTHLRTGRLALRSYVISKGRARRSGLAPASRPTSRTTFVLHEVFASPAGLHDQWNATRQGWPDSIAFVDWANKARVTALYAGEVLQAFGATEGAALRGKLALTLAFKVRARRVAEGKRLLASHAAWAAKAHPRSELLSYRVTAARERANALDHKSRPTRQTTFVLTEVFASQAGLDDHWRRMKAEWPEFKAFLRWAHKSTISALHGAPIVHALWSEPHTGAAASSP